MLTEASAAAFTGLVDLASAALGGQALLCSDEFFAGMERLVVVGRAVFDPSTYTERGKEMDGWESRRKRVPGHDWCILRLGVPGVLRGFDIDTAHFLGNHPPFASVEATAAPADAAPEWLRDSAQWTSVLPQVALQRGSQNLHAAVLDAASANTRFTHVRLSIFPDGGVARLRVYGQPRPELGEATVDLACTANGGRALACSDMFFSPMNNLLLPGRATDMGKGWETRRSRPPKDDWIILELGVAGRLESILLDTNHFKGNFPDTAAVDALYWPGALPSALVSSSAWETIVPMQKLRAHEERTFAVQNAGPWTHLRLRIVPDGGVSRMRAFGRVATDTPAESEPWLRAFNELSASEATAQLTLCCGASRWVRAMVAARPFLSRTALLGQAECLWWALGDGDWREAFEHHPRIGTDRDALRAKFAATAAWAESEQAGTRGGDAAVLDALARANRDYEARFGHIFIVCATGLDAPSMLSRLLERMANEPAAELRVAAGEQMRITLLRLAKVAGEVP